jgi:hypothetical protein
MLPKSDPEFPVLMVTLLPRLSADSISDAATFPPLVVGIQGLPLMLNPLVALLEMVTL